MGDSRAAQRVSESLQTPYLQLDPAFGDTCKVVPSTRGIFSRKDIRYCLNPDQSLRSQGSGRAQRSAALLPATGLRSTQISSLEPPWGPLDGVGEL